MAWRPVILVTQVKHRGDRLAGRFIPLMLSLVLCVILTQGAAGMESPSADGEGAAGEGPNEKVALLRDDQDLESLWNSWKERNGAGESHEAREILNQLYSTKLDQGIRNLPIYAATLLREGERLYNAGRPEAALDYASLAEKMAPDLYAAHAVRGYLEWTLHKWKIWKIPQGILKGAGAALRTYQGVRGAVAKSLFLCSQTVLLIYFTFIGAIIIRYRRPYFHDISDRLPDAIPDWAATPLGLIVLLLPLFLHLGVYFTLAVPVCLLWLYMSRREQILSVTLALFIAFTPEIMTSMASFFPSSEGDVIQEIFEVKDGEWAKRREEDLRDWADRHAWDEQGQFALGLISKRRGDYGEAEARYREVLQLEPSMAIAHNNLGNVLFARGQSDEAAEHYREAVRLDERLAAPHYNLSLIYQSRFELIEGEAEFRKAWERDADLVNEYVYIGSPTNINRFVIDAYLPTGPLLKRFLRPTSGKSAAARKAWREVMPLIPFRALRPFALCLLLALAAVQWLGKYKIRSSRVCLQCGGAACQRCSEVIRVSHGLCFPCHQIYTQDSQIDPLKRIERTRMRDRYRTGRNLLYLISSALLPGLGHFLSGRTLRGGLYLGLFLLLVLQWEYRWDFDSASFFASAIIDRVNYGLYGAAAAALYAMVMTDAVLLVRKESRKARAAAAAARRGD